MLDRLPKAEPRRSSARGLARFILVCAPKGGVGKTTISRSLLVCGAHAGLNVLGVDLDPQRGLLNWADRREASRQLLPDITSIPVTGARFSNWQPSLIREDGPALVVVDTPPGLGEAGSDILQLCERVDLVLIPLQPSFDDWEQVASWMTTLRRMGVRAAFQFNQANVAYKSYSRLLGAAVRVGTVSPRPIPRLESIHGFSDRGLTVHDTALARGSDELASVFDFVRLEVGI